MLALGAAPAIVRASSLMKIVVPSLEETVQFGVMGEFQWNTFSEELAAITRRAFVPKMVTQIYDTSPLLRGLIASASAERLLSFDRDYEVITL